ncbi:MAG: hypothetical protein CL908_27210 [Deltaproteobacteria bacterium]|jgi:hypothetical protein|nr:hypothetical protein [Deltaproteobacteria bacterium]
MNRRTMNPSSHFEARSAPHRTATLLTVLLCLIVLGSGCAFQRGAPEAYFDRLSGREAVESQLAGEALSQRKYSMRRIRRDLASFRQTLEQLQRHGKQSGITRFERFARPFIANRVDPLISEDDPTSHPELRPFRAELLLSKAVVMHQMRDTRAVQETIARLENEFASMTSMLVLYPTGEAVTLQQGITLLRMQTGEI